MSANWLDNVELRTNTQLAMSGDAVVIGTAPGAKSVVFSNDLGAGHLAWNPVGDATAFLPPGGGTLVVAAQTVALAAGTQTATSGTVVFSDSNGVSFGMSGSSRITAAIDAIRSLSAGTTRVTNGEVVFSNSNGVSFGVDGQTVTASINPTAAGIGALAAGTQTATSGTVVFSDSNGVSFGLSGSTRVTASVDGIKSVSAGTTRVTNGEAVFSNSNGVSFGVDGQTVTGSVAAGATATGNFGALAAGTQTATSGTVVFSDSNGVSFGLSGSSRVTASVDGIKSISAGTTRITNGEAVFSDSNGISFGANGQTVTARLEQRLTCFSNPSPPFQTFFTISNATASFQKVSVPMHLTATRAQLLMNLTGNRTTTGAFSLSVVVYTISGSTASLASSGSTAISWTSNGAGVTSPSSVYGGQSGTRYRTVPVSLSMTPGDYIFGWNFQTGNNGTWAVGGRGGISIVDALDSAETDYFLDAVSVSSTTAFPASIVVTDTNYARTGANPLRQPGFIMIGSF